jgi:Protein involved in formate dehydrogenase formation
MPTKPKDSADPIVQRLRALIKESPDLKDAAELYEAILPLLRDADLHVGTISLTPEQARAKMEAGLPLLSGLDLDLDVEAVRELMIKLARAVETVGKKNSWHKLRLPWLKTSSEPDSAARRIRLALEENRLDISALLPHIAAGDNGPVATAAQSLELDPGLVWTLAQNALKPALRAWCRQLTPLAKEIPWNKGNCFVCGAAATLGELQENDQTKHLRCGSCGADWRFRRLQCLHCGNEDHRTQRYLYDERNREKMRVEVCDKCKGYLKVISSFTPTPPEMLPIEDLAALHLDYIARDRGYTRG